MKWRMCKSNNFQNEVDKEYPIIVLLSREESSDLQVEEINCGNYKSPRAAVKFIQSVKRAAIKFERNYQEGD